LHLPLMTFALAAGMWTHLYAALGIIPILAGEGVRYLRSRKADWGMWGSLAIAGIACLPLYSFVRLGLLQSATYFSHASLRDIPRAYMAVGGPLFSGWSLVLSMLIGAAALLSRSSRDVSQPALRELPTHEVIAVLTILLIPVLAVLIGQLFVSGAFVSRYAMAPSQDCASWCPCWSHAREATWLR